MSQTLKQWERERLDQLSRFFDHWEAMHAKLPDHYPLEMEAGDWDEQFDLFCEPREDS